MRVAIAGKRAKGKRTSCNPFTVLEVRGGTDIQLHVILARCAVARPAHVTHLHDAPEEAEILDVHVAQYLTKGDHYGK